MNTFEAVGVLFGILSVWLTTRENVWCWPTGLVNVGLFIVVFGRARLYADMGLQVFYVALCLYGWYAWLHGGTGHGPLRVTRAPAAVLGGLALLGAAFAVGLGLFLRRHTDAALPFWDASTTSCSLAAQFLQTRKWLENWTVWIAVDAVYVGIYIVKSLYLTAGLYVIFLGLAVAGHIRWRGSLVRPTEAFAGADAPPTPERTV